MPSPTKAVTQISMAEFSLIFLFSKPQPPAGHPDKYFKIYKHTSRLPRKRKFGMEAVFNQTHSDSCITSKSDFYIKSKVGHFN